MSSPSDTDLEPLVEHQDVVELPPKPHLEDVVYAVRKILAKPLVQSITIRRRKPIEVVWFGVEKDTLDFDLPDPDPADIIRNLDLEEVEGDGGPEALLGKAVLRLEQQGLLVSHAVVGTKTLLWDWLGLDLRRMDIERPRRLVGGLIVPTQQYKDYLLVLVGSSSSISPLQDAIAGVKIAMSLKKEVTR